MIIQKNILYRTVTAVMIVIFALFFRSSAVLGTETETETGSLEMIYEYDDDIVFADLEINIYEGEAKGKKPFATAKTDKNGYVLFEGLPAGVYYIDKVSAASGGETYDFAAFTVSLPSKDGGMNVGCKPKSKIRQTENEYSVTKEWADYGHNSERPSKVNVDIYKNGAFYTSVVLDQSNNWNYKWKSAEENAEFTVEEKDPPSGYSVSVSQKGNAFVIINKYIETTPTYSGGSSSSGKGSYASIPITGDDSKMILWMFCAAAAGITGIAAVKNVKRKHSKI